MDATALEIAKAAVLATLLSSAAGLRVFLPPLGLGLAAHFGLIELSGAWAWLADWRAIAVLAGAALLETAAFYVPLLDHLLDAIAAPAALLAGSAMAYALLDGADPVLRWTLVVVAGAAPAAAMQVATSALRVGSTATTGGLGNFLVATFEAVTAGAITALAFLAPLLAIVLVAGLGAGLFVLARKMSAQMTKRRAAPAGGI